MMQEILQIMGETTYQLVQDLPSTNVFLGNLWGTSETVDLIYWLVTVVQDAN